MKSTRRRLALEIAPDETLVESFNHLGPNRSYELRRVIRILFDEFEEAQRSKLSDKKKGGRILKLVLFGIPAGSGGDPDERRECPHIGRAGKRYTDFNLLVIVSSQFFASPRIWKQAQERFLRELTVTGHLSARVNFIVQSIMDINDQLAHGRPFFTEIVRNGIMLYEAPGSPLVDPTPPDPEAARIEMHRNFDHWFSAALQRFELASEALRRGFHREAAFDLHQSAERLYHCILLVRTLYTPKSHRLTFLRSHAERIAPQLIEAWPDNSRFARRCFDLLDQAYIGARYSRSYKITVQELDWLVDGVKALQEAVAAICLQHLNQLDGAGAGPTHGQLDTYAQTAVMW